jgi:succinate dehydrogenase / fumarate reductase, cytochrome b subunit
MPLRYAASWTTVGKKLLMGLTGLALVAFVIVHLIGNLLLLSPDPDIFNLYADRLMGLGWALITAEIILVLFFVVHIYTGVTVGLNNRKARPAKYEVFKSQGNPSRMNAASRSMLWTGLILAVFTVFHVWTFKFGPGIAEGYYVDLQEERIRDLRRLVADVFSRELYVIWYVSVMVLLGVHVSHGFWSAFQSLGANHPRFTPVMYAVGYAVAILLAVGFILIPLWIYFLGVPQ